MDIADARIPVTDHGFLYGDGIFEGLRIRSRRIFRLDDHLARFETGARLIGLELPGGRAAARRAVLETASSYGEPEAYVRLIATRGEGPLGVDPATCHRPRLLCLVTRLAIFPDAVRMRGLDLVTSSLRRPPADVLDSRVKSLNYLNNALAKLEARQHGADDALLLNAAGSVAEASVANVFALRDGELLTPPGSDGALEGITRATILDLAPGLGVPAREKTLGRFDLFAANEVFLTGSGAGLVPVRSLDGRPVGDGRGMATGTLAARLDAALLASMEELGTPFAA